MNAPDFLTQVQEARSDLHLMGLLRQIYPAEDMAVLLAALARAQELLLLQQEKDRECRQRN